MRELFNNRTNFAPYIVWNATLDINSRNVSTLPIKVSGPHHEHQNTVSAFHNFDFDRFLNPCRNKILVHFRCSTQDWSVEKPNKINFSIPCQLLCFASSYFKTDFKKMRFYKCVHSGQQKFFCVLLFKVHMFNAISIGFW